MLSATTSLPGEPGSVPTARRWVRSTLTSWDFPDTGWTAAQVVSELATNVTLHARSAFTLRLTLEGRCVRLEVEDGSPVTLQARRYGQTATTGRGLHIVEELSLEWGSTPRDGGKTVWALLTLEDGQGGDGGEGGRRSATAGAGGSASSPTSATARGARRGAA